MDKWRGRRYRGKVNIPEQIEVMMADIAFVLHLSLEAMEKMSIKELNLWHSLAMERLKVLWL